MKAILDVHTHTVASGHGYSTMMENIKEASNKNLELLAITDHASLVPEGYFRNLSILPEKIHGVTLWKGVEIDILDYNGTISIDENILKTTDIRIASLHKTYLTPGSLEENTQAICAAMENPYIQIIGHPGDPRFLLDMKEVVSKAKKTSTILEINNAQLSPKATQRKGAYAHVKEMAIFCREMNVPLIMGSDAHFSMDVGNFEYAQKLLLEIEMPAHLILNTNIDLFTSHMIAKENIYADQLK